MSIRSTGILRMVSIVAVAASAACTNSNPAQPSQSADVVADAALTASIIAPRPLAPANNSAVVFSSQPVTLTVLNAIVTRGTDTTYTFEVATDSGFSTKAQTKDNVAQGSNGQTSVRLDALASNRDYYWHTRATGGGTTGVFGSTFKFTVGPAIVVNAPSPISPLTNTTTSPRPALRVTNATRSGPTGAITYRFEVANSSAFTGIVASSTVSEGVNETGFIPSSDLPQSSTLFWRAFAIDASNGITSDPSAVQSFTAKSFSQAESLAAQLGQTLWPGITPPGTVGHATMGTEWNIATRRYVPGNVLFQSPDIEMARIFDLLDRGFDPGAVSSWLNANGYPSQVLWYPPPEKAVLGLQYVYIASRNKITVNGIWDIVTRVE